ncbi:MAG: T9SS type A sorting domain-containing protein [Flavobacteriales bacterium]
MIYPSTKRAFFAAIIALVLSAHASGQSIWFRFINGLEEAYNLTDVRKITYGTTDQQELTIHFTDNTSVTYGYPDILSYYFSDNSVSVAERDVLSNARMVVYPNPAENTVTLSWLSKDTAPCQVAICDIKGRQAAWLQVPAGPPGLRTHTLSLEQFQSGVYIVRLMSKNSIQSTRIIKN